MPAPALVVEFGFNKSGTDYVWNDISAYVRTVNISRGTNREIEAYSAGSATIELKNNDRRFDPTYSSSPYFGQIKPAGAVRIKSGGLVQFYGFIDNWSFDYPETGFDAIATISAYDGLSNLAKVLLDDTYNSAQYTGNRIQYILNKPEIGWLSSNTDLDGGNSTVYGDTILQTANVSALSYIQRVAKSEPGDFFVSRDGKATFRDRRYLENSWNAATTRYNFCKNPNFEIDTSSWTGPVGLSLSTTYEYIGSKSLQTTNNGVDYLAIYDETDSTKYVASTNYKFSAYIYYPTSSNFVAITVDFYNGTTFLSTVTDSIATTGGSWQRVSLSGTAPANTNRIKLTLAKGLTGGILYVDAVLIEPVSTLGDYFDGTFSPVSDGSTRYTSRWVGLTGKSTSTLETSTLKTNPTISSINFSDYSGTDIPYSNIRVTYNSENLFNKIVLSKESAPVSQVKEDTTLQNDYGIRAYGQSDLLNSTDAEVANIAAELLSIYGKPELRVESIDLYLHGLSAGNQATVLAMDMRQLVQITFQPARTGPQMVKKYVIIGINHAISRDKTHVMTLTVASIDNLPFHLNSAMLGVLDEDVLSY